MRDKGGNRWVILIYQLPTRPSNLRVRVWRRVQKLGAVGIRNSAYILPNRESCLEDFQWLKHEIVHMGGEASVFAADSVDDMENEEIEQLFRDTRNHDYSVILEACKDLSDRLDSDVKEGHLSPARATRYDSKLKKIISKFDEVRHIDFFSAPLGSVAQIEIEKLKSYVSQVKRTEHKSTELSAEGVLDVRSLKGKVWVTRKNPHIDRIASGWLIKKFIDNEARFGFVREDIESNSSVPQGDRIPFDMYSADFGHHGEYCTFETFIRKLGLDDDRALVEIAEIVHDIDLKDSKFGRMEARGVDEVITGLGEICEDDHKLLEFGGKVFEALYARMKKAKGGKDALGHKT